MEEQIERSDDFDFQIGDWNVKHRRLKERLVASVDWEEFDGTCSMSPVLGGNGNVEDNVLHIASGSYRAVALRSFDPRAQAWAIWWLDSLMPHRLDIPVIGSFEGGIGTFCATETIDGRAVKLRFQWMRTKTASPRWEQAMSTDDGKSWETNWTMDFHRQ